MNTQSNHPSLIRLFNDISERIPLTTSFIANRADPTQVNIHNLDISKNITLRKVSTFGEEIILYVGNNPFIDVYIDNDGVYFRQEFKSLHMKYLRSIIKRFEPIIEENPDDDPWYDCIGNYE